MSCDEAHCLVHPENRPPADSLYSNATVCCLPPRQNDLATRDRGTNGMLETSQPMKRGKILELMHFNQRLVAPLAVSLGAIAGALSRYYLTIDCNQWLGTAFPYGTFLINLSGALVMGFFTTLVLERIETSPDMRRLIAVSFLGSYTTFSTYELDAERLLVEGRWEITSLYWFGTATLGMLCLEFGGFLARRLP